MNFLYWFVSLFDKSICPDCGGRDTNPRRVIIEVQIKDTNWHPFYQRTEIYGKCENPIHYKEND
jgi:hypothetical protein